jgi:hypothetical protein
VASTRNEKTLNGKMAVQKTKYEHIELSDHPDEPLPAYSTTWGRDGVQDSARPKRRGTIPWALAMDSTKQRAQTIAQNTPSYLRHTAWPALKKIRFTKIQFYAFCLVAIFGIAPLIIIGQVTSLNPTQAIPDRPFFWVFAAKTLSCGYAFGTPQNSTVSGWEALFVLDATFGKLPFSQVKTVDVAWDLLVGRGVQLLAWWASYKVFSNALLRVIERHPSSYQTFAHICLEGPCMASMWALIKDLGRIKSKRTWFLYFYMILSIIYTLCIPLFLSAMTGYINNTVAWVDIDSTENLIPAANFKYSYLVYNVGNTTFDQTCEAGDEIKQFKEDWNRRSYSCEFSSGQALFSRVHELINISRRLQASQWYRCTRRCLALDVLLQPRNRG